MHGGLRGLGLSMRGLRERDNSEYRLRSYHARGCIRELAQESPCQGAPQEYFVCSSSFRWATSSRTTPVKFYATPLPQIMRDPVCCRAADASLSSAGSSQGNQSARSRLPKTTQPPAQIRAELTGAFNKFQHGWGVHLWMFY